jgi:hypothetical protein
MEEKQMSERESLLLIQQMITTAKKEQVDDGKGWIIWGWMLFLASIFSFLNLQLNWGLSQFLFWNVFGIITILYFLYKAFAYFFIRKRDKVVTYTSDLFAKLNTGFTISLFFIIVAINVGTRLLVPYNAPQTIVVNIGFALLVNLYAFWILIYGTALNFKPSIIAAYVTWAIGIAALFMHSFEQVMLLHALATLVGYIIPGHIANNEFKKLQRKGDRIGV